MTKILYCFLAMVMLLTLGACSTEEAEDVNDINKQTLLVFMPWSGSTSNQGLYPYFEQNLDSIESAIKTHKGLNGRLLVFLSTSSSESSLYEVTYGNMGQIIHTPIKTYSGNLYTTADGITQILNDVKENAYALNYAMIIGCHGCGWTYKADWENYPYRSKLHSWGASDVMLAKGQGSNAWPTTRFYGSVSDANYATDIPDLAKGIAGAGLTMQFILFDDCYMANIETAYALRNVTNYLLGSTSEVMAVGMPYQTMFNLLAKQTPDYSGAVQAFKTFYSSYDYPYGSISAIDCRQTEKLATIMREINTHYTLADSLRDSIQVLGGFQPTIFYDLEDYAEKYCGNTSLLSDFRSQLDNVVKYHACTDSLYSYLYNAPTFIKVKTSSGVTISDPSTNSVAIKGREKTDWWKDTH